jgi:transcriptional regulator NrdR family protein
MLSNPKCPQCGSYDTTRSHRRPIERVFKIVKPYRCDFCSHRFRVIQVGETRKSQVVASD